MKIKQTVVPNMLRNTLEAEGSLWVKTFMSNNGLGMIYSLDRTHHGTLYHLSISRLDKYPDWDDIVKAKEMIMGDMDTMMVIPKRADYINVNKFCFHIWQMPKDWNIQ